MQHICEPGRREALEDHMLMLHLCIYCDQIVAVKFYINNLKSTLDYALGPK